VKMSGSKASPKVVQERPASALLNEMRHSPDQIRDLFRNGKYPYKTRIKKAAYEAHKEELQVELLKVQNWVKLTGQRIVVICEGRDAAGKGGTIKRFMEHLNPRASRVVALEKPTDHERGQWYAPGTTAPVSNASWGSVTRWSILNLCGRFRTLNACWPGPAFVYSNIGSL